MKKHLAVLSLLLVFAIVAVLFPMHFKAKTTEFNYGEALQKSLLFYEFQRSGKLPADKRDNWRGDSGLEDGKDVGLDLTGGWYDAGDHVKFNLPMSYTAAMLAWSVYEDRESYEKSGQLKYALSNIKWANDYFIKCHPSPNEYYYQVGDGDLDHRWWVPAEVMQMNRPSFKVDLSSPGSTVSAETAASLAACSIVFSKEDQEYSKLCLKHAKELYNFAEITKSDAGYKAAENFYKSWSGFYDELSWAAVWLYLATNDDEYLKKAKQYVDKWSKEQQSETIAYKHTQCWDDVHYGAQLLLAKITGEKIFKESVERNLDYWTVGYEGNRVAYTPKGLAWLSEWGALRYATTAAFLADLYADSKVCTPEKISIYKDFAKKQVDYALGSSGKSYVVGFGNNPPQRPHHRTSHSSWADNMDTPPYHRHVLVGALVGGPDRNDNYEDKVNDYVKNEVACDYNAGFTAILARMYGKYGGELVNELNAVENKTNEELFVEAGVNVSGSNFIEIRAYLNNRSGWPARVCDKLSFRYFIDITEAVKAGYTAKDITTVSNYSQGAKVSDLIEYNKEKNIYYVNVDFSGTKIFPGGQSEYKKEVQFRILAPQNTAFWDNSNDFSYTGLSNMTSGKTAITEYMPVYDNGNLVFGKLP